MTNLHTAGDRRNDLVPLGAVPFATLAIVGLTVLWGATTVLVVALPENGPEIAVICALSLVAAVATSVVLARRPWCAPWGVLIVFVGSAELRLRVSPALGTAKDVLVLLLAALVAIRALRQPTTVSSLRPLAGALAPFGVLIGLYLLDPGGEHNTSWLFGTRLLMEVLALLLIGLLCLQPRRTLNHLLNAMTVVLPVQAVVAWVQQVVGEDVLVYQWGYQFGSQVRLGDGGGLRTSATFEDPFQLAALAVLGLAMGLFLGSSRQRVVLIVSALAILGATSVRTAVIQAGLLLVLLIIRRGWLRQAVLLGGVSAVAGVFLLATTTSSNHPGARPQPLILTLNGRATAWSLAVQDGESFVVGSGVGARGIGSTRQALEVSAPPAYDPNSAPPAAFAGNPAFLDSAYAQVQSDVGIVGTMALLLGLTGLAAALVVQCRKPEANGATWAALGVLFVSMVDWIGRSSLSSYTTGFLTTYVLGVLVAASGVLGRMR